MATRTSSTSTIPRRATAAKPVPAPVSQPTIGAATKTRPRSAPAAKPPLAPAARPAAAPAREAAVAKPVPAKAPKLKLVRDSFTMPEADYAAIAALKKRAVGFQRPAKKSELLRAGLHALAALDDARLKAALDALVAIKTGRPKKH